MIMAKLYILLHFSCLNNNLGKQKKCIVNAQKDNHVSMYKLFLTIFQNLKLSVYL